MKDSPLGHFTEQVLCLEIVQLLAGDCLGHLDRAAVHDGLRLVTQELHHPILVPRSLTLGGGGGGLFFFGFFGAAGSRFSQRPKPMYLYLLWTTPESVSMNLLLSPRGPAPVSLKDLMVHSLHLTQSQSNSLLQLLLAHWHLAPVEGTVVVVFPLPGI